MSSLSHRAARAVQSQLEAEIRDSRPGKFDATERWLPVPDWPGYEVSDLGRLRSYHRKGRWWHQLGPIGTKSKPVGGYLDSSGHLNAVLIRYKDGVKERRFVGLHCLVLEAFVGPCPPGLEGCHNDGNPADNRLEKIRWDTPSSNMLDRVRHGGQPNVILHESQIPEIWDRLVAGEQPTAIARDYGVERCAIRDIKLGRNWKHITSQLPGRLPVRKVRPVKKPIRIDDRKPIRIHGRYTRTDREIWKPIPGWTEYFRVSNFGRVQSRLGFGPRPLGDEPRLGSGWHDLTPAVQKKSGHLRVTLTDGKKRTRVSVHVAVLMAFACARPEGMLGCHIDDDPRNNYAGNLKWDTHKGNARDRARNAALKAAALSA
jgi:hypothetical protein